MLNSRNLWGLNVQLIVYTQGYLKTERQKKTKMSIMFSLDPFLLKFLCAWKSLWFHADVVPQVHRFKSKVVPNTEPWGSPQRPSVMTVCQLRSTCQCPRPLNPQHG